MLYGIHLWADLIRDRRVSGSRPNQNDYGFFVILVTYPKSYIETTDRRDYFGGKPSKWWWRRVLSWKIPEFCSFDGARSKNSIFRVLGYPSAVLRSLQESLSPNQWYWWKAETLKVCLLLVWRVCDHAFGRYRPLKGAEKRSLDYHEIENLHIDTRRKIHWFQKCYIIFFSTYDEK